MTGPIARRSILTNLRTNNAFYDASKGASRAAYCHRFRRNEITNLHSPGGRDHRPRAPLRHPPSRSFSQRPNAEPSHCRDVHGGLRRRGSSARIGSRSPCCASDLGAKSWCWQPKYQDRQTRCAHPKRGLVPDRFAQCPHSHRGLSSSKGDVRDARPTHWCSHATHQLRSRLASRPNDSASKRSNALVSSKSACVGARGAVVCRKALTLDRRANHTDRRRQQRAHSTREVRSFAHATGDLPRCWTGHRDSFRRCHRRRESFQQCTSGAGLPRARARGEAEFEQAAPIGDYQGWITSSPHGVDTGGMGHKTMQNHRTYGLLVARDRKAAWEIHCHYRDGAKARRHSLRYVARWNNVQVRLECRGSDLEKHRLLNTPVARWPENSCPKAVIAKSAGAPRRRQSDSDLPTDGGLCDIDRGYSIETTRYLVFKLLGSQRRENSGLHLRSVHFCVLTTGPLHTRHF